MRGKQLKRAGAILWTFLLLLTACSSRLDTVDEREPAAAEKTSSLPLSDAADDCPPAQGAEDASQSIASEERLFYARIGETTLEIVPEENRSADAFLQLLAQGDITLEMNDYGSFEKVGDLGASLPTNDVTFTTEPGDVILYQGKSLTIYYDVNTWQFTKLGKIREVSPVQLKELLGDGDVTVTFSLDKW